MAENKAPAPKPSAMPNAVDLLEVKKDDYKRQTTEEQRKSLDEKPVTATLDGGTKVAGPKHVIDRLR